MLKSNTKSLCLQSLSWCVIEKWYHFVMAIIKLIAVCGCIHKCTISIFRVIIWEQRHPWMRLNSSGRPYRKRKYWITPLLSSWWTVGWNTSQDIQIKEWLFSLRCRWSAESFSIRCLSCVVVQLFVCGGTVWFHLYKGQNTPLCIERHTQHYWAYVWVFCLWGGSVAVLRSGPVGSWIWIWCLWKILLNFSDSPDTYGITTFPRFSLSPSGVGFL